MLPRLAGIFGWREREITTAKISACRTKRNAGHGHRALLPTAPTITPRILQALTVPTVTPLILPAPTALTVILHTHPALTPPIPIAHIHLTHPAPMK